MKFLKDIITKQKSNFPLDQVFFKDQEIFDFDLKTFFLINGFLLGMNLKYKIEENIFYLMLEMNL